MEAGAMINKKKEATYRVSVLLTDKERRLLRKSLNGISFNSFFRAHAMTMIATQTRKDSK
jgi:hypothetical protein